MQNRVTMPTLAVSGLPNSGLFSEDDISSSESSGIPSPVLSSSGSEEAGGSETSEEHENFPQPVSLATPELITEPQPEQGEDSPTEEPAAEEPVAEEPAAEEHTAENGVEMLPDSINKLTAVAPQEVPSSDVSEPAQPDVHPLLPEQETLSANTCDLERLEASPARELVKPWEPAELTAVARLQCTNAYSSGFTTGLQFLALLITGDEVNALSRCTTPDCFLGDDIQENCCVVQAFTEFRDICSALLSALQQRQPGNAVAERDMREFFRCLHNLGVLTGNQAIQSLIPVRGGACLQLNDHLGMMQLLAQIRPADPALLLEVLAMVLCQTEEQVSPLCRLLHTETVTSTVELARVQRADQSYVIADNDCSGTQKVFITVDPVAGPAHGQEHGLQAALDTSLKPTTEKGCDASLTHSEIREVCMRTISCCVDYLDQAPEGEDVSFVRAVCNRAEQLSRHYAGPGICHDQESTVTRQIQVNPSPGALLLVQMKLRNEEAEPLSQDAFTFQLAAQAGWYEKFRYCQHKDSGNIYRCRTLSPREAVREQLAAKLYALALPDEPDTLSVPVDETATHILTQYDENALYGRQAVLKNLKEKGARNPASLLIDIWLGHQQVFAGNHLGQDENGCLYRTAFSQLTFYSPVHNRQTRTLKQDWNAWLASPVKKCLESEQDLSACKKALANVSYQAVRALCMEASQQDSTINPDQLAAVLIRRRNELLDELPGDVQVKNDALHPVWPQVNTRIAWEQQVGAYCDSEGMLTVQSGTGEERATAAARLRVLLCHIGPEPETGCFALFFRNRDGHWQVQDERVEQTEYAHCFSIPLNQYSVLLDAAREVSADDSGLKALLQEVRFQITPYLCVGEFEPHPEAEGIT